MFLRLKDRFGQHTLVNMATFTVVAPTEDGNCRLYPGDLNERYHGVSTLVNEPLAAFEGLPGFIAVADKHESGKAGMLVNMERIARVVPGNDGSYLELHGISARIETKMSVDDIGAAMGAMNLNRHA